MIEGEGGHRYTVVHTGCVVPPPPPIITVGSNFPRQVGTFLCDSMVEVGAMTSQPSYLPHLNPPSYRVLLLPAGPEEINEFSFKHSSFIRIPHRRMRKEK